MLSLNSFLTKILLIHLASSSVESRADYKLIFHTTCKMMANYQAYLAENESKKTGNVCIFTISIQINMVFIVQVYTKWVNMAQTNWNSLHRLTTIVNQIISKSLQLFYCLRTIDVFYTHQEIPWQNIKLAKVGTLNNPGNRFVSYFTESRTKIPCYLLFIPNVGSLESVQINWVHFSSLFQNFTKNPSLLKEIF